MIFGRIAKAASEDFRDGSGWFGMVRDFRGGSLESIRLESIAAELCILFRPVGVPAGLHPMVIAKLIQAVTLAIGVTVILMAPPVNPY